MYKIRLRVHKTAEKTLIIKKLLFNVGIPQNRAARA
jgi:hypothetical protein